MADITLNTRIQLRNDTEVNWLLVADTAIPLVGEVCITNDGEHKGQFKIGDGATTWGDLPYANSGADIQVDASQVMFSRDLVFTETFGKYVPSGGKVTVPANGDSLLEVLLNAFATDSNPSITQPSVNISSSSFKAYEVGTNVTPAYTATLNPGSYQYGPATGITATSWNVVDNAAEPNTLTTASGSFPQMQVVDGTSYSITATASYGTGTVPNTALGQEYADGQIKADSKSATKGTISGYRNGFYGTTTSQSSGTFESNDIRALTATNKAVTAGTVWNISIPVGARSVIFAYPATIRDATSVLDANGLNAEIKTAFTKIQVQVAGANGYNPIEYKVYYTNYANANDTQNTYKVTI